MRVPVVPGVGSLPPVRAAAQAVPLEPRDAGRVTRPAPGVRGDCWCSTVRADTAYRAAAESHLRGIGKVSPIHVRTPRAKPMARPVARANAKTSAARALVEHSFAVLKGQMRLTVRTIGPARAKATITLAVIASNRKRWCWLASRRLPAGCREPRSGGRKPSPRRPDEASERNPGRPTAALGSEPGPVSVHRLGFRRCPGA